MTSKGKLAEYYSARARAAQYDKDWDDAARWMMKLEKLYEPTPEVLPGQVSWLGTDEGQPFEAPAPLQGKLF